MRIKCVNKLRPIVAKPKRIKIIVGGRGSTKSTFVSDYALACMSQGELWCCAREFQNSIDESVHRLMLEEVDRLGFDGFTSDANHIYHASGGRNFYKGLARNVSSLKSMLSGVDKLWIEEGESLSENTLRVLTASLRLSAKDSERVLAGEDVKMPEIIITMNRGSINDPVAKKWLERAEPDLERCGYYEDDTLMVVEVNYTDMPKAWFEASGLEPERKDDWEQMPRQMYDHKWHGKYLETVENAIILPEWFDACIDAHVKLGFKAQGLERFAYDPADTGDNKAIAYCKGCVFEAVDDNGTGLIDTATDWATSRASDLKPDVFIWDADGMGMGLKRQITDAFKGKKIDLHAFSGAAGPDRPNAIYEPPQSNESDTEKAKTNSETFTNKRAQRYWLLRDRMFKTWQAVEKGVYHNPDELISFSSDIEKLSALRAELCRIPRKYVPSGRIQLLSKAEMKKLGIKSPNMADAVMMASDHQEAPKEAEIHIPTPRRIWQ